ncbi:MAG TPA: carbonic anhydrase [Verrucomicrobiae bacterium]|jgi:carbonic anhydrase|nr:carbonic anhydrase [Verrucomicrobiae bacterium]
MRLFEAIVDANHRAIAGDAKAGVHVADFENELPVIALTCVDPRLNALFPNVLGLPGEEFIWLRNAGNIITGPLSSTMRSLALACAVKGGKEIAIIGHTDCQVGKTTTMQLLEKLEALGVKRHLLPENLNEFFGMFGSDRQNVIKACDFVRGSPLIGPKIPVHGLLVDIQTGKLEWLVNGYQNLGTISDRWNETVKSAGHTIDMMKSLTDFQIGEMKFPDTKIGETVTKAEDWLEKKVEQMQIKPVSSVPPPPAPPAQPPKIPVPPTIRPRMHIRREGK